MKFHQWSLLPSMNVHYLGNVFIGSLTGYMQSRASIEIQALYGVVFSLGVFPTTLMILWTKFFSSRWLSKDGNGDLPDVNNTVTAEAKSGRPMLARNQGEKR